MLYNPLRQRRIDKPSLFEYRDTVSLPYSYHVSHPVILYSDEGKAAFAMPHLYRQGGGMTMMQPHRVHLSIASPVEIERTAQQLMTIREDFLTTGSPALWTPRPLILDSWHRCRSLHVNPSRRCAPLAVARESQLDQLREANALLIRAAQPIMSHLIDFLAGSGYVVVLSDVQGCLLDVVGDPSICRRLARIDFVPGGNWSEAAAGTNAIGTALADGHIVQLMAAEHYCDGWQDLTCTAAPIRHPFTNEVIGILDVTGDYRLIRSFLTSFLARATLEIKQRLQTLLTPLPHKNRPYGLYHIPLRRLSKPQIPTAYMAKQPISSSKAQNLNNAPIPDMQSQLNRQERRAYEAERLAAATGIISASLDLDVTIEKVVEQVAHLLYVDRAGVLLLDEEDEIASIYVEPALFPSHPVQSSLLGTLLQQTDAFVLIQERGEPVVINDTLISTLLPPSFVEQTDIRALMLLPLVTARGVNGFILVSRSIPYTWAVEDIRLGLAIATQSATAIENARLFAALQQHNRHIETLNTIAQILNTLPYPTQHLDLVLQRISELLDVDASIILLFNQTGDHHLGLSTQYKLPPHIRLDMWPWRTFHTLALHVITQHKSAMISLDDCDEPEIHQALLFAGFYSLMAAPLATSDASLGVLLAARKDHKGSNREDLKFFSTIGQQLGLALRNAQLRRSASEMEVLREADRLKSGFLAAVSHDLRSPLTAIHASVESLLDADGIQSATGVEHLLRNIAGQANRLGLLVDQLLDLSKIEAGALPLDCDWVELSVLLNDAIIEFERLHCDSHIEKMVDQNLPLHYVDSDRLVQVLWNLLENAYKYAPSGSSIQVEARSHGQEVLIRVADRGPGIPREEHEKVFQRFYRLEREQQTHTKGSGLGLAICKGIVEAHGGRIWLEDRDGGGCIFIVALRPPEPGPASFESPEEQALLV
jgi:signal transduction histidine kinase